MRIALRNIVSEKFSRATKSIIYWNTISKIKADSGNKTIFKECNQAFLTP